MWIEHKLSYGEYLDKNRVRFVRMLCVFASENIAGFEPTTPIGRNPHTDYIVFGKFQVFFIMEY